jgi:glutamine amidotransferase
VTPGRRDDVVAVTHHGGEVVAAIDAGNITGTQFHPEKSGPTGLTVYANFVARCVAPVRA